MKASQPANDPELIEPLFVGVVLGRRKVLYVTDDPRQDRYSYEVSTGITTHWIPHRASVLPGFFGLTPAEFYTPPEADPERWPSTSRFIEEPARDFNAATQPQVEGLLLGQPVRIFMTNGVEATHHDEGTGVTTYWLRRGGQRFPGLLGLTPEQAYTPQVRIAPTSQWRLVARALGRLGRGLVGLRP